MMMKTELSRSYIARGCAIALLFIGWLLLFISWFWHDDRLFVSAMFILLGGLGMSIHADVLQIQANQRDLYKGIKNLQEGLLFR